MYIYVYLNKCRFIFNDLRSFIIDMKISDERFQIDWFSWRIYNLKSGGNYNSKWKPENSHLWIFLKCFLCIELKAIGPQRNNYLSFEDSLDQDKRSWLSPCQERALLCSWRDRPSPPLIVWPCCPSWPAGLLASVLHQQPLILLWFRHFQSCILCAHQFFLWLSEFSFLSMPVHCFLYLLWVNYNIFLNYFIPLVLD